MHKKCTARKVDAAFASKWWEKSGCFSWLSVNMECNGKKASIQLAEVRCKWWEYRWKSGHFLKDEQCMKVIHVNNDIFIDRILSHMWLNWIGQLVSKMDVLGWMHTQINLAKLPQPSQKGWGTLCLMPPWFLWIMQLSVECDCLGQEYWVGDVLFYGCE